jgi:hypothetical protein
MTRSRNSRRGIRGNRRLTGEASKGASRSAAVKQRNHRRTRAMFRGSLAHGGDNLECAALLVPPKNAQQGKGRRCGGLRSCSQQFLC